MLTSCSLISKLFFSLSVLTFADIFKSGFIDISWYIDPISHIYKLSLRKRVDNVPNLTMKRCGLFVEIAFSLMQRL